MIAEELQESFNPRMGASVNDAETAFYKNSERFNPRMGASVNVGAMVTAGELDAFQSPHGCKC